MGLVVVVLAGAVALGRLRGGRLGRLAGLPVRRGWLVAAAVAVQATGGAVLLSGLRSGPVWTAALAGSAALVALFLAANRRLAGVGLVALGLGLNALVVALNGAMPVSVPAAARVGVATRPIAAGADPRHVLSAPGTAAGDLGDVLPVALPLRPEVVSIGDVLVAAGLARLVLVGMRRRRPARRVDRAAGPASVQA